jgi:hypothetical protein
MATETRDGWSREKTAMVVMIAAGIFVAALFAQQWLRRPPQMGASEDVFRTVDALYTAVRLRDAAKIDGCEAKLRVYRDRGELPKGAARSLETIIAKARGGSWESATERLYEFMMAQRREGVIARHRHEGDVKAARGTAR